MEQPLINILIRTSNRPTLFKRCLRSIERQTYKNVRVIVSYDTINRPNYVSENLVSVNVCKLKEMYKHEEAFYNRYCNVLISFVQEGVWFILDDDDYIPNKGALQVIAASLKPNTVLICQMTRNGKRKPLNLNKGIESGKIGTPCFFVPVEFKDLVNFDGSDNADYKYIKALTDLVPYKFLAYPVVEAGRRRFGKVFFI